MGSCSLAQHSAHYVSLGCVLLSVALIIFFEGLRGFGCIVETWKTSRVELFARQRLAPRFYNPLAHRRQEHPRQESDAHLLTTERPSTLNFKPCRLHGSTWMDDPTWKQHLDGHRRSEAVNHLRKFIHDSKRLLVITGAGASTASGIPDYRGANGSYKSGHMPILHQDFVLDSEVRKRYWGRSLVGFETMKKAEPNRCHRALAAIEKTGRIQHLITQNVDGLHQQAGSSKVTDLHGNIDRVKCLQCGHELKRAVLQKFLRADNADWVEKYASAAQQRADGDAELREADYASFVNPKCPNCVAAKQGSGLLKPDVVFYGDNVPKGVKDKCMQHLDSSDTVLVVGSSLEVQSAYRYVVRAAEENIRKPICILNLGVTRAERSGLAPVLKIHLPCDEALWDVATVEGWVS